MKKLVAALAVVILAYLASPYAALALIYRAAHQADDQTLASRVDFDAVRSSLSEQLTSRMRGSSQNVDPMQRAMFDTLIHSLASPRGVAMLVRNGGRMSLGAEAPEAQRSSPLKNLDWFFFTGPTRFEIQANGGAMVLEPRGVWWRVVDVKLPPTTRGAAPETPTPSLALPPSPVEAPVLEEPDFGTPSGPSGS